ncbi:hypothetical protein ACVOMT_18130 [Sphingomonas panni]
MPKLFLLARVAGQDVAILSDHVGSVVDIADISPFPGPRPPSGGLPRCAAAWSR